METKPKTYRIVRLKTESFQRITAEGVEIVPNSNLITLAGNNGEGKSSVLSSIIAVLRGKKYLPDQPIHRGSNKAETFVDFGDFTAEMKISANTGPRIVVKSKTGLEIKGPQTFLESKSNEILLDLSAFIRQGETPEGRRRQAELLRKLVGVDLTALDAEKARLYQERTNVGRDLDAAKGRLTNFPFDSSAPKEEVSASELVSELQNIQSHGLKLQEEAQAKNRINGDARRQLVADRQALATAKSELSEADNNIKRIEEMLAQARADYKSKSAAIATQESKLQVRITEVDALKDEDVDAIRSDTNNKSEPIIAKINKSDEINMKVRGNRRHLEIKGEIDGHNTKIANLTARIDQIDKEKTDQLANAKFPLEGLSFDESGIILNGLPLASASTAEQLKAVLAIGMALEPEIRVAVIREASFFDEDSLKELESICEKYDSQVWLEDNRSSDPRAYVIEDGTLKE